VPHPQLGRAIADGAVWGPPAGGAGAVSKPFKRGSKPAGRRRDDARAGPATGRED